MNTLFFPKRNYYFSICAKCWAKRLRARGAAATWATGNLSTKVHTHKKSVLLKLVIHSSSFFAGQCCALTIHSIRFSGLPSHGLGDATAATTTKRWLMISISFLLLLFFSFSFIHRTTMQRGSLFLLIILVPREQLHGKSEQKKRANLFLKNATTTACTTRQQSIHTLWNDDDDGDFCRGWERIWKKFCLKINRDTIVPRPKSTWY